MAKIYYNNFIGGLSYSDRMGPAGSYLAGSEVNPFCDDFYNYLIPEKVPVDIVGATANVTDLITDFEMDPNTNIGSVYLCYGLGDAGHFYKIKASVTEEVSATGIWPYQISAGVDGYHGGSGIEGHDLLSYKIGTTNYMLYSWDDAVSGSVGIFDLGTTFEDDFTALSAASPGMLSAGVPHPMIEGEDGKAYIGNGYKIDSFDGQTGANGTYASNAFDIPAYMEITSLFRVDGYLGITAWKKTWSAGLRGMASVYLWDYVSPSWSKAIDLGDNYVSSSFIYNGNVYVWTSGQYGTRLKKLTNSGTSTIIDKLFYKTAAINNYGLAQPKRNATELYSNKILFGTDGGYNVVYSYGQPTENTANALVLKHVLPGTNCNLGAIKRYFSDYFFVSLKTDTVKYTLRKYTGGETYSANAYWAGLFADFGQKVRINYIKYYFRPLVSGDSMTPTISLDYGTATGLIDPKGNATISYANDGAITSKRFNVKQDCWTISPRLAWTSGGTPIQKIVIDYTLLTDS